MPELGSQPKPFRPPPPPIDTIRCAACHTPLMMAPIGATAGLCVGLSCIQPDVITAARLRDFNAVMQMVLSGRMKAELEPETLITWLSQVKPKPPPRGVPLIQDDGSPTFRDWDPSAVIGGDEDGQQ